MYYDHDDKTDNHINIALFSDEVSIDAGQLRYPTSTVATRMASRLKHFYIIPMQIFVDRYDIVSAKDLSSRAGDDIAKITSLPTEILSNLTA